MYKYDLNNIIETINDVPEEWIYKYYYEQRFLGDPNPLRGKIYQPFDGRIIRVRSAVSRDTNPSLVFYYKNGHYLWNDFSSGMKGDAVAFVSYILNKNRSQAEINILYSYEEFLSNGGEIKPIIIREREKAIFEPITKSFSQYSIEDFASYKISLSTLNFYKVKQLDEYKIKKGSTITTHTGYTFGFFCNKGLYQIYSPGMEKNKYIHVDTSYLIGSEQLEFKSDNCLIISGLKDIMALRDLQLDVECVAGLSETSLLSYDQIDFLRSHYKFILTMFDNDRAGLEGMRRYKKVYDIDFVHVQMEKDLAENNRSYSPEFLRAGYTILINKKINM